MTISKANLLKLKVKAKSLAEEARIIRKEEHKLKKQYRGQVGDRYRKNHHAMMDEWMFVMRQEQPRRATSIIEKYRLKHRGNGKKFEWEDMQRWLKT